MSITHPAPLTPANPMPASGAVLPPFPDDVRAFCDQYGLGAHVAATARMLRETFPPPGDIEVSLFTDPESDDENPWVAVVVAVRSNGDVPTMLRLHSDFLDRWIPATPAAVRDLMIPRFVFA